MNHTLLGRSVLAAGSTVALLTVAACGSTSSTGSSGGGSATDSLKIGAVIKGLDNPFFQAMESGIQEGSKTENASVSVQAAASISDTTGQADKLSSMAGQDYNCFIINPITGTNLVQGLAQLSTKKVPLINIDSPIDAAAAKAAGANIATYIGTDNTAAGEMGGAEMAKLLPSGGDVALIGGTSGDVTSAARLDGFKKGIPANINVVQTVAADWDRQTALTKATDLITAQPNLKAFFVANDDMGLGVAKAIANANKKGQIKVISVDGIKDGLEGVKSGDISAVVAQYPFVIGQMGAEACKAAHEGKTLPTKVTAPVQVVTSANVDKALSSAPKPAESYADPIADLLK
ncbi:allose-binding protein [Branchiibius hedensis]|uniref:Allose-binding protein n=1 Tax=Branchiibius hedensis TaxID=672460 RepID=A0A2Y8ZVX3_9MICO|nr:substrate-binding domain-containing protein [Branchiibius hedensis]PWJ27424.1 allose-binding protein [Branchiibius hedensis]SSA36234.1 allose-binding protein [Branchiibius hedensis]